MIIEFEDFFDSHNTVHNQVLFHWVFSENKGIFFAESIPVIFGCCYRKRWHFISVIVCSITNSIWSSQIKLLFNGRNKVQPLTTTKVPRVFNLYLDWKWIIKYTNVNDCFNLFPFQFWKVIKGFVCFKFSNDRSRLLSYFVWQMHCVLLLLMLNEF